MRFSISIKRSCSPAAIPAEPKISSISSRVSPLVSGTKSHMNSPPAKENAYKKFRKTESGNKADGVTYPKEDERSETELV